MSNRRRSVNRVPLKTDDVYVSTRDWRAVREGETHTAVRTSHNRTPESFIVGVGASGILLAGAAITFVTLVGLVSFNVWPAPQGVTSDVNIELGAATAKIAGPSSLATAPPVGVPAQIASTVPASAAGGGTAGTAPGVGPGSAGGGVGHHGGTPRTGAVPVLPVPPSSPGNSKGNANGQGDSSGNGQGGPHSSQGTGSGGSPGQQKQKSHPHQAESASAGGHGNGHGSAGESGDQASSGQSDKHQAGPPGQVKHHGGGSAAPVHSWDSSGHGRGHGPKGPKH